MDIYFDEIAKISADETMSSFERSVGLDIYIHFFEKNAKSLQETGLTKYHFDNKKDMYEAYWKEYFNE